MMPDAESTFHSKIVFARVSPILFVTISVLN